MIDEKKLVKELEHHLLEYKKNDVAIGINVVKEIINNQPQIGGWILCSERLPEIKRPVLVCDKQGNICIRQINSIDEFGIVWWSQYKCFVIAWQPLPEPYHE